MAARYSDILVIGAGPSGLLASLLASQRYHVTLIERDSKQFQLGKRILVSGNGRANFFNRNLLDEKTYDKDEFSAVKDIVLSDDKNYAKELISYFRETLKFTYREEGDLFYPFFNKSECLQNLLVQQCKRQNVEVIKGEFLSVHPDQKEVHLLENGQKVVFRYGKLFLALGGMSLERKTDPLDLLKNLNLKTRSFSPCLCPVKVKEKMPQCLNKNRLKGILTLKKENEIIYQEEGEILFKEDGISGICVFDSTLYLNRALEEKKTQRFIYDFSYAKEEVSLDSYPQFLRDYFKINKVKPGSELHFTFASLYPFSQSQISYGGISFDEINKKNMTLKKYPDIALAGEMLQQAFICGGYNMGMAMIEGFKFGKEVLL